MTADGSKSSDQQNVSHHLIALKLRESGAGLDRTLCFRISGIHAVHLTIAWNHFLQLFHL